MTPNKILILFIISLFILSAIFLFIFNFFMVGENNYKNRTKLTNFFEKFKKDNNNTLKKVDYNSYEMPFRIGERLKYGIYSAGIKVGDAIITYLGKKELDGIMLDCISLEAKAPGFYDFEKIYGEIKTSSPIRIERRIRLFGRNEYIIEEYNQKENLLSIIKSPSKMNKQLIKSQEKFNNIILLLYHFRYMKSYKLEDQLQFNLPTKKLKIFVDKETKIKIPMGEFDSLFVRSIPAQFKVWFRNDGDSIPLRIQGVIGFGNTYLALIDVN